MVDPQCLRGLVDLIGVQFPVGGRDGDELDAGLLGSPGLLGDGVGGLRVITAPQRGVAALRLSTLAPVPLRTGKASVPAPKWAAITSWRRAVYGSSP